MTHDQMLALAVKLKQALSDLGADSVEIEEHEPGDPIPLLFNLDDTDLVIELNTL